MKSDVERKLQAHKKGFFEAGQVSWNRNPLINTSCATYKRMAALGKILNFLDFSPRYS